MWAALSRVLIRHPARVLVGVVIVTAALSAGLPRLDFRTGQDTLVSGSSKVYRDNLRYEQRFGGEAILTLFTGDIQQLFSPANLAEQRALEAELRAEPNLGSIVGPVTVLEYARAQLAVAPDLLVAAAQRTSDPDAYLASLAADAQRLAAAGAQDLSNPAFVQFLLYNADGTVRDAVKSNFLDGQHGVLIVRLAGNLTIEQQGQATQAARDIIARHHFDGFGVLATGSPVMVKEINDYLEGGMATLGLIAAVAMLVLLALAFPVRLRLLPLLSVAIGTLWALGAAGWIGIPLSLVTISGLPIFIGLGVDFAIQMHNRYGELRSDGAVPERAVDIAVKRMAGPLSVSMIAAAVGFLALRISDVPMIRDFGLLLSLGVLLLVVAAIIIPVTILGRAERRANGSRRWRPVGASPTARVVSRLVSLPGSAMIPLLLVAVAAMGAGFALEGSIPVQTDPESWIDQNGTAVRELKELRAGTGFSDEVGIMVEGSDVTDEAAVAWIHRFASAELKKHPELVSANSAAEIAFDLTGTDPTGAEVRRLLAPDLAPADIVDSVLTSDHKTANLVFPVGQISLSERETLMNAIEADLRGDLAPPAGISATPSGLAVVGVELVNGLEANRRRLTVASVLLVTAWLLIRGRFRPRAVLPLVPVAIAVGLATVAIHELGLELTPLTTVAGPLVIAVATEFAVLIEARYHDERHAGRSPADAVRYGIPRIGRAFVASGLTLIGGFGVLAFSPMPLLRDFGAVVSIDVVVALVSALVVLPPLLVATDRPSTTAPEIEVVPAADTGTAVPEKSLSHA